MNRPVLTLFLLAGLALRAADPQPDNHARRVRLAEKLKGGIAVLFAASEPRSMLICIQAGFRFLLSHRLGPARRRALHSIGQARRRQNFRAPLQRNSLSSRA